MVRYTGACRPASFCSYLTAAFNPKLCKQCTSSLHHCCFLRRQDSAARFVLVISMPMQLLMLLRQPPHQRQTLTDTQQQQQVLSPTFPRRRSYWQHPCLVTAAAPDRLANGGSLLIMPHLHQPIKRQQLLSQLLQPRCRQQPLRSLLLLICCWDWTPQPQHLLHQHLQVALQILMSLCVATHSHDSVQCWHI